MSDTDTVSAPDGGLTAQENAYFESGGQSQVETPEVEQKPETVDAPEDKQEDKVERVVPLAAVHEERAKRKALQERLRASELEAAELKGRFKIIERLQEAPEKVEPRPRPEDDPFGAVVSHEQTIQDLTQRLDKYENASKQSEQANETMRSYQAAASTYLQEKPDFMAAYQHLLASRAQELETLGYTDPAARAQALHNEEMQIAQRSMQSGKNPAETIYQLATQRGYVFKDPKKDTGERLENIERGQAQNKSLTNTGGNTGEVEMTADRLIKMPIEDFEAWCNKNPAKAKRLMGG